MSKHVHTFKHINEFHHAANGGVRSKHEDVHVFRFRDLSKHTHKEMPLFTTTYYQIGLMRFADFSMSVYENEYRLNNHYALVMFKPGQLIRFKTDLNWDGYVIHFKENLLSVKQDNANAMKRFSILDPSKDSFFLINKSDYESLGDVYERMLDEYDKPILRSIALIELYVHVLFHKVNEIFERQTKQVSNFTTRKAAVNFEFKKLVNEHLGQTKTISDYADMLGITPKYLIESVSEVSGISPKNYVTDRIVSDTKTLLKYSDKTVYEIALSYSFKDASHFSNFFKKESGVSPLEYRNRFKGSGG